MGRLLKAAFFAILLAYPFVIYLGAELLDVRWLAVLLLLLGLARVSGALFTKDGAPLKSQAVFAGAALAAIAAFSWFAGKPEALYYYPVLVNLLLLALFGASLVNPPSIAERIARLSEPDLPPEGQRYTRKVTMLWCGFFIVNGAISLATALPGDEDIWLLYNGIISYILMGLLFAGEYLVRRRVKRKMAEQK